MDENGVPSVLDAVVGIARDLRLPDALGRIVRSSRDLVGAGYGALAVLGPDGELTDVIETGAEHANPVGRHILEALIGRPHPVRHTGLRGDPAFAGCPADHPLLGAFLAVPIRLRDRMFGRLYLAGKAGGGEFTRHDEDVVRTVVAAAAVAIENATLFAQVERRGQWLEAAHQVTDALLTGQDMTSTIRLIAQQARVVAEATYGAVAWPHPDDPGELVFEVIEPAGPETDRLVGLTVPADTTTATGVAFTTRKSVTVRQYGDKVLNQQRDHPGGLPPLVKDLDSTIAIPLLLGGEALGVLLVAKLGDQAPFTDSDVRLAETFAGHAALAVAFARAEDDRARLAVFEDRDRIARDLHDVVIQRLFATGLGLEGLSRQTTDPATADRLTGYVNDLDRIIRDIRDSIFSLQEPDEARGSLRSELLRVALDAAAPLGFEPKIGFAGPIDSVVPEPVRADLVATLRESLSNVVRHAAAASVAIDVSVDRAGQRLRLVVTDDGVGIPRPPVPGNGLGNLDERAARWGGTFTARPADGGGTRLAWTVPLAGARRGTTHPGEGDR